MAVIDGGFSFGAVAPLNENRGGSRNGSTAGGGLASGTTSAGKSAADTFLDYMKKSAAERMTDAWLAAHGLTRADLAAMSPEKRDAVMKQMAEDIRKQMEQEATAGPRKATKPA
jgi:hypothetical protein